MLKPAKPAPRQADKNDDLEAIAVCTKALQKVYDEREDIVSRIDFAVRHGHVPDGLPHALHLNLCAEVRAKQQLRAAYETALSNKLLQLSAQFPEPQQPEPERPRIRVFGLVSGDLTGNVRAIRR